jgi:hypothetical protein
LPSQPQDVELLRARTPPLQGSEHGWLRTHRSELFRQASVWCTFSNAGVALGRRSVPQDYIGTKIDVAWPTKRASLDLYLTKKLGVTANRLKDRTLQKVVHVSLYDRSIGQRETQPVACERNGVFDTKHRLTSPRFYGKGAI